MQRCLRRAIASAAGVSAPAARAAPAVPAAHHASGTVSFYDFTLEELTEDMKQLGVAAMRSKQMWQWVYQRGVIDVAQMANLGKDRTVLAQRYSLNMGAITSEQASADGTRKWLISFGKKGAGAVETVFIPEMQRGTACLSSQVGCSLNCKFCHTGAMDKASMRNLTAGEIVAQFMTQRLHYNDFLTTTTDRFVSNIVFMGMGEPLYNYRSVKKAVNIMMHGDGLGVGKRRIILSTSGVVPLIERVGTDLGVGLAVSLHAVTNELRDHLVPLNKTYPLEELLGVCRRYPAMTNSRKITFEYVMLKGVNDSVREARMLVNLLKGIPSLVNLIPFNPWPGSGFECSSEEQIVAFARALEGHDHLKVTIRWPRGRDIMAACGQLATSAQTQTPSASTA